MSLILSSVALLALVAPQQDARSQAILDGIKQFEGHWAGAFSMGPTKFDVDMTWKRFGGTWVEVSYTYSAGDMKLEYRVLMTPNADKSGLDCWMFGTGQPGPDTMKAVVDGKALNVVHLRANQPDIKFTIDAAKNMVMSVTMPPDDKTEIAHGVLKPIKG